MAIDMEEFMEENSDILSQQEFMEEFENKKNKNTIIISKYSKIYKNNIEDYCSYFNIY